MPRLKRTQAICQNIPCLFKDEYFDQELMIWQCEKCNGVLGVDGTYIEQEAGEVHCPMCGALQKLDRLEEVNEPILKLK